MSHGCLRLYPEDIGRLYALVAVGTTVAIVREAVKVGVLEGRVHVEVHRDGRSSAALEAEARRLLARRRLLPTADPLKLERAVREGRGVPVDVAADVVAG